VSRAERSRVRLSGAVILCNSARKIEKEADGERGDQG
jgi:hypothetical protein